MTTPLTAAVLVLQYEEPFRSGEKYMGRAAHKIALGLMATQNSTLVQELHDQNAMMPLTISDLFQSDAHHHWFRITALRPDVIAMLEATANQLGLTYDGWCIKQGVTTRHDWSGKTTAEQIIHDHWKNQQHIQIQFETLTAIKSKGLYRSFPEPELVFKSLYERYCQLIDAPLPYLPEREILDLFLTYGISVNDYRLHAAHSQMKHSRIQGFKGEVHYFVETPTRSLKRLAGHDPQAQTVIEHYDDLTCLVNTLAQFGFYLGVGIKTAQGMGMMRVMDV